MTPTQGEHAQEEALRPKFGDLLRNTMASDGNPRRDAYFIREVHRSGGGVNPGRWFEMTDGKGETWLSNPQNMVTAAPAQPAAPQGVAYAELPKLFREALAWGMTYGPEIPAHQWEEMRESMVKQYTERASNGQAPAGAAVAPATVPDDYGGTPMPGCGLEGALPKLEWVAGTLFAIKDKLSRGETIDRDWNSQAYTMASVVIFVCRQIAALDTPTAQAAPAAGAVAGPTREQMDAAYAVLWPDSKCNPTLEERRRITIRKALTAAFAAAPTPAAQADSAPVEAVQRIVHLRADREHRVYVAGPMTGLPEYNFPLFNATASKLRSEGWHVENPAEHGHVEGAGWADYLRWDISRIATCGAIYLLPGWEKSKGARLEVHIAGVLGLRVLLADGAEAPPADSVPEDARKENICIDCTNADSWGLPDKPCCQSCVASSNWQPLNRSSVHPNTARKQGAKHD